jgi:hypothetical protein
MEILTIPFHLARALPRVVGMFTRLSRTIYFPYVILVPSLDHWISELAGLSALARWMLLVGKVNSLKENRC